MVKIMLLLHRRPGTELSTSFASTGTSTTARSSSSCPGCSGWCSTMSFPALMAHHRRATALLKTGSRARRQCRPRFASAEGQAVAADAAQFLDLSRMQILVVAES